jgi:predicted small lipoprotein YifL
MKKFVTVIFMLFLAGCGKKGPLIPPEAQVPAAIADLSVRQQGKLVLTSWTAPGKSVRGKGLEGIASFRIFRREVLPPGEDCEACPGQYREVKTVDPQYLQGVERSGNRFSYTEALPTDRRVWQYRVVAVDRDGAESLPSNPARFSAIEPPLPPRLSAVSSIEGIHLSWEPVRPTDGKVAGYLLFRRKATDPAFNLLARLPAAETKYEDVRVELGVPYRYTLRSIVEARGAQAESDPSPEVEGKIDIPAIRAPEKPQL